MDMLHNVDSSFLGQHYEELNEIFATYLNVINPFIVQFEILRNEFPVELQNEIRAMYGHLSRAALAENEEDVQRNIQKIKSHTKRAVLDCYKYSCIIFTDHYTDFFERYKGVDLSYLDNGTFLHEIHSLRKTASDKLRGAKRAETSNISEQELFDLYEDAYNCFGNLDKRLQEVEESATFLKHRATKKDHLAVLSFVIGIIGTIAGIIGIAISFI